MNAFALSLLGLAIQATLILLLAASLLQVMRWRKLRAERTILLATLGLLFLLPVAWWMGLPSPFVATFERNEKSISVPKSPEIATRSEGAEASPHEGFSLAPIAEWMRQFRLAQSGDSSPKWWGILGGIYLLGVVFGGIRFGLAIRQIQRFRREVYPLDEEELRDDLEVLGINQRIDMVESVEPSLTATLGLLRPTIVLPIEWREWSISERRAAIAHEVAHIRNRDFVVALLMQLAMVFYWCHPLVFWLRRRVRWQQELDADTLAASLIGGRGIYRKSLALLALRLPTDGTPRQPLLVPALTGGTLIRRLDMLRFTDEIRSLSRRSKTALLLLLTGFAWLLTALSGPAAPPMKPRLGKELPPFDLRYLAPMSKGIIAVRPAEFLAQPGTEKFAKAIDAKVRETLKTLSVEVPEQLRLENIEQIVTDLHIGTEGTGKPKSRSLQLGASSVLIRMKEKFDFLAFVKSLPVTVVEKKIGEIVFYEVKLPFNLLPVSGGFFLPDERSFVFTPFKDEDDLKKRFSDHGTQKLREARPIWSTLDQSAFAIQIDNTDAEYSKKFDKDIGFKPEVLDFLSAIQQFNFAIELGDERPIRMVLEGAKATDMAKLQKQLEGYVDLGRGMLLTEIEPMPEVHPMMVKVFLEVTKTPKVKVAGQRLDWQGFSELRVKDYLVEIEKAFENK